MKLKQEKGYVGIDVSLAVIALFILVPTIMGILYAASVTRNTAEIKSEAISILTNTMETAKGLDLSELNTVKIMESLEEEFYTGKIEDTTLENDEIDNEDGITDEDNESFTAKAIITDKASYKLKIKVVDYKKGNSEATENTVKTVKATIFYKVGNKKQNMHLSTVVK